MLGDEATGGELEDEAAIELPIEVEIEGVERLAHGIEKWDTTRGGPGTVAHALTLLAGDRALIADLIGAIYGARLGNESPVRPRLTTYSGGGLTL